MSENRLTLTLQDDGTLDRVFTAECASCGKHWSERYVNDGGGFPNLSECHENAEELHAQDSPDCYDVPASTKGHDVSVLNEGTIFLFCAETDKGLDWLKTHLKTENWQWLGNKSVGIDHRLAEAVWKGIELDGLRVDHGRIH